MYDHVFLVDMADKTLFNLLLRHIVADCLKSKSITSKLQRIASGIVFFNSLHHNLVPTFVKVQDQLVNKKDKTRARELIPKVNLVEHNGNIQITSRNHHNFAEQLKEILFYLV